MIAPSYSFATALVLSCLASVTVVNAAAVNASATAAALAAVDAQFVASHLSQNDNAGFGVTLNSKALLLVTYANFGLVVNGHAYGADQVATAPSITILPGSDDTFVQGQLYTLMLADAASLGDPDVQGNYRHYLENSVPTPAQDASGELGLDNGVVITGYAGPGPIVGTGPHRYAWMLFSQPSTFAAPADLSVTGTAPGHWNVSSYVASTGLQLIAASFFTVENGAATGTVIATTAVSTSGMITSTTSAASSSATAAPTTSASSTSASASTTSTSTKSGVSSIKSTLSSTLVMMLVAASIFCFGF